MGMKWYFYGFNLYSYGEYDNQDFIYLLAIC